MIIIQNISSIRPSKYKAKLLENTVADGAIEILKNATIAVPLKITRNAND